MASMVNSPHFLNSCWCYQNSGSVAVMDFANKVLIWHAFWIHCLRIVVQYRELWGEVDKFKLQTLAKFYNPSKR